MLQEHWTFRFRRSVAGWVLVSARQRGGRTLRGSDVPSYVREYAWADVRGFVRNPDAVAEIEQKARGNKFEAVIIATDVTSPKPSGPKPPTLDWDSADYLGDGRDGVYFGAVRDGRHWWARADVDSETGSFTDTLAADRGYSSEKAAYTAARDAALTWLHDNRVSAASR